MRGTAAEAATYSTRVEERLAEKLRGKPADATLPAGTAPNVVETAPAPLTVEEIARRGRIGQAVCLFSAMGDADQRVWLRMLEHGASFEKLRTRCQEITEEAREPAGTPNNYRPTPREHGAIASLLSTVRAWRFVVLGPRDGDR